MVKDGKGRADGMRGRWDRIYRRFVNQHLGRHVSRTPPQCKNPSSSPKDSCQSEGFGELGAGQSSNMKLLSALHNVWPMTSICVSPSRAPPAKTSVLLVKRSKSRAENGSEGIEVCWHSFRSNSLRWPFCVSRPTAARQSLVRHTGKRHYEHSQTME